MNPLNRAPGAGKPRPKRTSTVERLRAVNVYNQYEFYGDQPYMSYRAYESRSVLAAGWLVRQRGVKLDDAWYNHGSKVFHGKMRSDALAAAQAWAGKRFNVEEWVRDPFGGYGPADYVRVRLAALLKEAADKAGAA